ncbi:hypothetical protein COLO4_09540 [Corchorus olitorius]|uniref:Uncharacterized protein n=1 Tax=Corchorus olitorius TaxID=93759 RepID=A0A1R3KBS2_9ROSI|nr:hypothetical protein COLO4_09540 [Corchorus olitorius]
MKSLLEFVACCVTTPQVSSNDEVVTAAAAVATPSREETRSLMPPKVVALKNKKKRVRVGTPEWKPSLYVISEDNAMAEKREKAQAPEAKPVAADRAVKRKSATVSRSKVHVRNYNDDING